MGWDLQSLQEDSLLTLDADVFGPLDEAGEISHGLDVTTDSKVTSILLEQGALNLLSCASTSSNNLLALSDFLHLKMGVRICKTTQGQPSLETSQRHEDLP